jgi:hypothetical protein
LWGSSAGPGRMFMRLLAEIGLVWVVLFAVAYFPGRAIGFAIYRWLPSLFVCLVAAELASVLLVELLPVARRAVTAPWVTADPFWFGVLFANICFFVPLFLAIGIGYRKAGRQALGGKA